MSGYGQYPPAWGGGYPAQSYPPQPAYSRGYESTPPYYAPPPHHHYAPRREEQPDIAVDPNAFRRFYMYHLSTLVHNSKPVITNLTMLAHDHALRMAPIVAQCLDDHLRTCDPYTSLPAFYLLDSISKNIGPPYLTLFARFVERAFLSAYRSVDGPTKIKMEELLGTWRTGANDGGELFRLPDEGRNGRVQHGIESALFGSQGRGGGIGGGGRAMNDAPEFMAGVQQTPSIATQNERSAVLFDVRRILQLRLDQVTLRPDDAINNTQIVALQQLESLVLDTQLSADQVHQIRGQLSALAPPPEIKQEDERRRASSANLMELAASLEPISSPYPSSTPAPVVMEDVKPNLAAPPPSAVSLQNIDPALLAQLQGLAGSIPGLSDLFAATTPKSEPNSISNIKVEDSVDRLVVEYDDSLRSLNIQLSNVEIARSRPEAVSFLYGRLGLQCKQCGLRYFDSAAGQKNMDIHLDWHFTHKRRIREGAARAQGRSWLSLEEDWIKSDDLDSSLEVESSIAGTSKPDIAAIDRAELKKSKVIAPTDPEKISKPCPICKERFQSEFSEVDEEWMFFNAVEVDGVIYHATCRAEAAAARIASRLKLGGTDSNRPSRESTPVGSTKSKSKAEDQGSAAKKRKAEAEEEQPGSQGIAGDGTIEEEERVKRIKLEDEEEIVEY